MTKVLFLPFSVGGALVAGYAAKALFERVWEMIDDEEPPDSKHREISLGKLLVASALEGAIFRAVKEAADHGSRRAFFNLTGAWPGEEEPEPER